jgi:citrate lyase synthetase
MTHEQAEAASLKFCGGKYNEIQLWLRDPRSETGKIRAEFIRRRQRLENSPSARRRREALEKAIAEKIAEVHAKLFAESPPSEDFLG